jgi:hypothetical protein
MVPSAHGLLLVKSCWWAHLLSSVISQSGPSPLVCQYRSLFTSGLSLLLGLLTICPGEAALLFQDNTDPIIHKEAELMNPCNIDPSLR